MREFQEALARKFQEHAAKKNQEKKAREAFSKGWKEFRETDLFQVFREAREVISLEAGNRIQVNVEDANGGTTLSWAGGQYFVSFSGDPATMRVVCKSAAAREESFDLDKLTRETVEAKVGELVDFFLPKF